MKKKPGASRGSKASSKREPLLGDGPLRKVVYIFEREGDQGGGLWYLVLECGHGVTRTRKKIENWASQVRAMFEPLESYLAPKRARCFYCGTGASLQDPWVLVEALGGPKR